MRCQVCGNDNRSEARFCDSCGARLAPPESSPRREAEAAPALRAPEAIGRYAVTGFLGRGGRKDVHLGRDADGREVAIALFDTSGLGEAALARARREMRAMERLGAHPHVVGVIETGEEGERPYIVSEHMRGGDVRRLLAESPDSRLTLERTLEIAIDVCRALEHAHGREIVHRDLKPANVWLDADGAARLGDFGLAATGPTRDGGMLVGTVAYLPPEQALGRAAGPRSDLYSLGVMIYEMATGRTPFAGDDAVSIIGQHLNAEPTPPSSHNPELPAAFDELVGALLAKAPEERPPSAAAVRERLEAIRDAPPEEESEEAPQRNPLAGLAGGVFVGRESELEELRAAADEALAGRGRLALLAGEPGIGKTRTAEEISTYVRLRGAKAHWGRCLEGEGAPAYWPWVQAIRSYAREADPVALAWELGSGAGEIGRVVPEVAELIGQPAAEPAEDDEQARFRLFDAISTFLSAASASRPLAIVLDDLHWADEPSLLLLEFIAHQLADTSLLLIGTYRDVELRRDHPLSRILAELSQAGRSSRVVLRGLREEDVGRYMTMTAGGPAPPRLVASVHAQTEGNPFFVAELIRLLASEGSLRDSDLQAAIPQGVRDVVGRRLDRLSPEANEVLRTAAAIGRSFDPEVLVEVEKDEPEALRRALHEAKEARLIEPDLEPGRFRFSHALVRETLYEELSAARRPALHSRIAAALETIHGGSKDELERRVAEVSHHYNEAGAAGDLGKAVAYATRAGDRALALLGYEEAAESYGRALEALEIAGGDRPRRRCELALRQGDAYVKASDFPAARAALSRAADDARALGDGERLARAALGFVRTAEIGVFDSKAAEMIEAALEAIEPGDSRLRAMLTVWLAQMHYWLDPQGRSARLSEEAVAMARRLDEEGTLAHVLSLSELSDVSPEAPQRGIATQSEVIALAQRLGERELELRAHALRLRYYLELGDVPAVDRDLERYAGLAQELRQPQHLWHVPLLRGMRAMIDGRLDDAERYAAEARRGGRQAGEPLARQFCDIQAALLGRLLGRLDNVIGEIAVMADRYEAIPAWRAAKADTLIALGRREEARVEFERLARGSFAAVRLDLQWLITHSLLAEVAFALRDRERGAEIHRRLAPYGSQIVVAGRAAVSWGPAVRYAGLASAAAGETARAVSELESSIAISRGMGDRPFVALAELALAQVLADRDAGGDLQRALELLDSCLAAGQELGTPGLVEDALSLKLRLQGLADVDVTTSIDEVVSAVESERPDIRRYAAPDGSVTILFSDIEGSTVMTERLGDARWLGVLRDHNNVFRECVRAHAGYEVKNQGDGFMLVFADPLAALRCAIDVQRRFAGRAADRPEEAVMVRMGLHSGEAIAEEGDFFGRNVILAARIAAQARGGEILVSEALRKQVDGDGALDFDDGRLVELKGLAGSHRVYRADWRTEASAV